MDFSLSIQHNEGLFLNKMITFEKRKILQHYFENKLTINDQEKLILERCPASEIETISLIGILLSHRTPINTFRLRIGSVFKSDEVLAQACQKMVSPKDITMAEEILFDWQYEYDEDIEIPIVDQYISLFKK